jgi:hypothetical protein
MNSKIILANFIALILVGCTTKSAQSASTVVEPNVCITYEKNKMKNPILANVVQVQGVALAPNAIKVLLYEGSLGAGFGALQLVDPKFNLRTVPGQVLRLRLQDSNESNVTYVFNNSYPYSFRVNDKVVVDYNGTDFINIKAF